MTYDHITNYMHKARLGVLLERSGVTREELAKLLNASPKTLAAFEKGDYDPPLSFAYKLAAALKVPVERLFSD
jgi:putative transcriptional regulator